MEEAGSMRGRLGKKGIAQAQKDRQMEIQGETPPIRVWEVRQDCASTRAAVTKWRNEAFREKANAPLLQRQKQKMFYKNWNKISSCFCN